MFVVASSREGFNPAEVLFELESMRGDTETRENDKIKKREVAGTLTTRTGVANDNYSCEVGHCIVSNGKPRWIMPIEAERLQGFPDNYTRIPYKDKDEALCPDTPRYKAIGNSMAVPVIRWIGERISKNLSQAIVS